MLTNQQFNILTSFLDTVFKKNYIRDAINSMGFKFDVVRTKSRGELDRQLCQLEKITHNQDIEDIENIINQHNAFFEKDKPETRLSNDQRAIKKEVKKLRWISTYVRYVPVTSSLYLELEDALKDQQKHIKLFERLLCIQFKPIMENTAEFTMISDGFTNSSSYDSHKAVVVTSIIACARNIEQMKEKGQVGEHLVNKWVPKPNQCFLYHGTTLASYAGILAGGLLIRPLGRVKSATSYGGDALGEGLNFTNSAAYAINFCRPKEHNNRGSVLMYRVAPQNPSALVEQLNVEDGEDGPKVEDGWVVVDDYIMSSNDVTNKLDCKLPGQIRLDRTREITNHQRGSTKILFGKMRPGETEIGELDIEDPDSLYDQFIVRKETHVDQNEFYIINFKLIDDGAVSDA